MAIGMNQPGLSAAGPVRLGLRANWPQFALLIVVRTHPSWRAQSLGIYRFWRDLGYAIGAVVAGLLAQTLGLSAAVIAGGAITFASGLLAARWITGGPSPEGTPRPFPAGQAGSTPLPALPPALKPHLLRSRRPPVIPASAA